jgi:hypothetical protein
MSRYALRGMVRRLRADSGMSGRSSTSLHRGACGQMSAAATCGEAGRRPRAAQPRVLSWRSRAGTRPGYGPAKGTLSNGTSVRSHPVKWPVAAVDRQTVTLEAAGAPIGDAERSRPGWTAFAWARLCLLAASGLFLELLALQGLFHALSVRDYQSPGNTSFGIVLPFIAPVSAGVVLLLSRRAGREWLSVLRRTAWTLILVAAFPAFIGALSTLI